MPTSRSSLQAINADANCYPASRCLLNHNRVRGQAMNLGNSGK